MMRESAQAFVERAKEDKAFEMAIWRYILSRDVATLVAFGATEGYTFTAGEIRDAIPQDWQPPRRPQAKSLGGEPRSFDYRTKMLWQGCMATILLGIAALYFVVKFAASYQEFAELQNHGLITDGWVENRRMESHRSYVNHRRYTNYYLKFTFQPDGESRSFEQKVSYHTYNDLTLHERVQIRYSPSNPKLARLKGTNAPDMWSLAGMIGFGGGCIAVAIRTRAVSRRQAVVSVQSLE